MARTKGVVAGPKVQDIIDNHKSGEMDGFEWFTNHFVACDDLAELGFNTSTLVAELNVAFETFSAQCDRRSS